MLDPQLEARICEIVPRLEGWCPVEKTLEMARSICESRPRICVEIGVFGGRSLLPQALVCQSLQHGHVFGIDPWSAADSMEGMSESEDIQYCSRVDHEAVFRGCRQSILDEGLTPYCSLIRTTAQHSADLFNHIDFLHIDGNHNREISIRDVQLYLPKVRPGGDIWFDDSNWPSTQEALRLLQESCEVVRDYVSYMHLRKRPCPRSSRPSNHRTILSLPISSLGSFRGGVYNPGAAWLGDRFLLLARNEVFNEWERCADRRRKWGSCRPFAITLNLSGKVTSFSPVSIPSDVHADRAEDFRLFHWQSQLFASFSRVRTTGQIEIQAAAVDLDRLELGTPITPRMDCAVTTIEKNWCFFEHRQQLFCLYSFQPFHLLQLTGPDLFQFQTVLSASVDMPGQSHPLKLGSRVSLSTSPVEFRGDLILFIHQRDREKNYHQYAVWLDSKSMRPYRITRQPVFSGGNAHGLRPSVLYLMSVLRVAGDYWFFFGEGDEHVSFLSLTETQLSLLLDDSTAVEILD